MGTTVSLGSSLFWSLSIVRCSSRRNARAKVDELGAVVPEMNDQGHVYIQHKLSFMGHGTAKSTLKLTKVRSIRKRARGVRVA